MNTSDTIESILSFYHDILYLSYLYKGILYEFKVESIKILKYKIFLKDWYENLV